MTDVSGRRSRIQEAGSSSVIALVNCLTLEDGNSVFSPIVGIHKQQTLHVVNMPQKRKPQDVSYAVLARYRLGEKEIK